MAGWRGAWHQLSSSSGDCDIKSELWGNTVLKIQTLMRFTFFLRSFLAAVCPLWIILTRWVKCESMWPFLATLKLALSPWQPAQKLPQCPPRRQIPLTLLRLLPIWEALKKWKWVTSTPAVNLWLNWGYFSVAALMWCVCNPFKRTLEAAAESGVRGSDWKQEKKTMCWIRQTEVEHFLYVCVCVNDAWWCSPEYLNMLTSQKGRINGIIMFTETSSVCNSGWIIPAASSFPLSSRLTPTRLTVFRVIRLHCITGNHTDYILGSIHLLDGK